MKWSKRTIWIGIGVVACGGMWYWWQRNSSVDTSTQYVTAAVERGTLVSSVSGSGNVVVDQSASVDPSITGTVENLSVKVGDSVTKGQLLFTIENDQLDVSVAKAVASLRSAEQSLASAKASKDSTGASLYAAERGDHKQTKKQIEALEASYAASKLGIISAEQNLVAARKDYTNQLADANKRKVIAPIDGTVNEINIKNGDDLATLSSGNTKQTPIIIGDLSTLKAEVTVNEVDIAHVSVGMDSSVTLDAIDGLVVSGKVEKVDALGTITQGVVTYAVTVGFDTLDERIRPGMSVSASLIEQVNQDVLLVPVAAVKTQGSETYVQVLANGIPTKKVITVGDSNGVETEVKNGLSEGDMVITQTVSSNSGSSSSSSGSSRSSSGARIPGLGGFGR